jgi:hypothetical protein
MLYTSAVSKHAHASVGMPPNVYTKINRTAATPASKSAKALKVF